MSLEQAMEKQAAAMEKQAAAMERHADAMNHYASVIEKNAALVVANGGQLRAAAGGDEAKAGSVEKPQTAKEKKAAKEAADKAAAAAADNDGFDDEPAGAPKDLTIDKVKAKLFEVKDAYGDKTPALKIATDLGYPSINDIKPVDFEKVWLAAEAAIAKAP